VTSQSDSSYPDDPDVAHLLRLLAVLPGAENVAFWNSIYPDGPEPDGRPLAGNPEPAHRGYVLGKMTVSIWEALGAHGQAPNFEYLSRYVMMFFQQDRPKLLEALDAVVPGYEIGEGFGRRFVEELRETAWRVAVRYNAKYQAEPADLLSKWPAKWPTHD
jgi:hypothetical protein